MALPANAGRQIKASRSLSAASIKLPPIFLSFRRLSTYTHHVRPSLSASRCADGSTTPGLFFPFITALAGSIIDPQVLVFLIQHLESQIVSLQTALDAQEGVSWRTFPLPFDGLNVF